jgi:diguanylate cyclase (GGDEF)-like protein/PAS domain S-box-containing protein
MKLRWRRNHTEAVNRALVDSRARYKALVELSSAFAWETGPDGCFAFVSPRGVLGFTAEELVGRQPQTFMIGTPSASPFATREAVDDAIVWWRRKNGGEACLSVTAMPLERDGHWRGARGVCRDVTAERAFEDALARARHREALHGHLARLLRDADGAEAMVARTCEILAHELGATARHVEAAAGAALRDDPRLLVCPTQYRDAVNGLLVVERPAGGPPWADEDRMLVSGMADQLGIALAQAAGQAALLRASRTDPLTGLLNRRAFEGEMATRLGRPANADAPGALLAIDLDNFKAVNDRHGHERGDDALRAVAALLVERTRPGDLVARLGGDEFAIWFERIDAAAAASRAGELIDRAARLAEFSGGPDAPLGLSVGVAVRRGETDLAAFVARADAEMYVAKRRRKAAA